MTAADAASDDARNCSMLAATAVDPGSTRMD